MNLWKISHRDKIRVTLKIILMKKKVKEKGQVNHSNLGLNLMLNLMQMWITKGKGWNMIWYKPYNDKNYDED